jgi:hypothetical protein
MESRIVFSFFSFFLLVNRMQTNSTKIGTLKRMGGMFIQLQTSNWMEQPMD